MHTAVEAFSPAGGAGGAGGGGDVGTPPVCRLSPLSPLAPLVALVPPLFAASGVVLACRAADKAPAGNINMGIVHGCYTPTWMLGCPSPRSHVVLFNCRPPSCAGEVQTPARPPSSASASVLLLVLFLLLLPLLLLLLLPSPSGHFVQPAMASGIKPAWQAVARKKQQQRDEVMQRFADAETAGSEVLPRSTHRHGQASPMALRADDSRPWAPEALLLLELPCPAASTRLQPPSRQAR